MAAAVVTKDTLIGDLLRIDANVAPILLGIGMHCLGCAMANGETVGEACQVHGVDEDEFLEKINAFVK